MVVKFSEVKIGQKFVFDFDKSQKDGNYYYSYEKTGLTNVKCLTCPKTENVVGREDVFTNQKSECHILEEKKEGGYTITSNGMKIGTAYDGETFSSLVRLVYLSCYKGEYGFENKTLEVEVMGVKYTHCFIDETVFQIVENYF